MRVLVVDDEQNIRRALTLALESMEHEVASAANGTLALKELKASRFDVITSNRLALSSFSASVPFAALATSCSIDSSARVKARRMFCSSSTTRTRMRRDYM